jgi:hypothetical protein
MYHVIFQTERGEGKLDLGDWHGYVNVVTAWMCYYCKSFVY